MAGYDRRYLNKMRQDAIRRSREMNSRSMGDVPPEPVSPEPPVQPEKKGTSPSKPLPVMLDEILGGEFDADKLLIAALLLMLLKEGSDRRLLLALGYILL